MATLAILNIAVANCGKSKATTQIQNLSFAWLLFLFKAYHTVQKAMYDRIDDSTIYWIIIILASSNIFYIPCSLQQGIIKNFTNFINIKQKIKFFRVEFWAPYRIDQLKTKAKKTRLLSFEWAYPPL
jgi:hypothetical protein